MPKPAYGHEYESTTVGSVLGFEDRFNTSWHDAKEAFNIKKARLLGDVGLRSNAGMRMLEALEWNLIANREGWGKTNTSEWTNTEYREPGDSYRLVIGDSDYGGAANVNWINPDRSHDDIGFRAAVVLGS